MRTRYALLLAIYIIIGVASVRAAAPLAGDDNAVAADVLVSRSLPLGTAWADSTYAVSIVYPEFTPLTTADLERYQSLLTDSLGALPAIASHIVVDRKRGYMEVSFVPIALRDGRYVWLTDFDLELTATPKAAAATSSTSTTSSSSPTTRSSDAAARYADHSVLASGSWAKIRVSESGVYQLTEALVRKAGFSSLSNV